MGVDTRELQGFDDLIRKLRAVVPAMRKRVIRNALAAGGRIVRDEAKRLAPVLQNPTPYRTRGLLKKSLTVRTSKVARRAGDVGVFVNVKPLKVGRGAKNPRDPYYWSFVNFGTKKMAARPFLSKAADKLPQALNVFKTKIGEWFAKTERSGKVTP